jgi:hypothetical protein
VKAPARPTARLLRGPEAERLVHHRSPIAALGAGARAVGRFARRHDGALILTAILVIAALPRLWAMGAVGFRGDEAVYAGQAGVLAGDHGLDRYFVLASRGNSNFLYYQEVVAFFYWIFGVSDTIAWLVAAAFSIGTVAVVFELGRTLYSRNVGLIAAGFIALSGYAVLLGRLALLDSALVFLFTLSFLWFAKWLVTRRDVWLYAFAGCSALTIQCKVTGGLVLIIALNYLLVSRELNRLSFRRLLWAGVTFLVFFIPVLVQIALKSSQLLEFLNDSGARTTHVPLDYYADKLISFEWYVTPLMWIGGIVLAVRRWGMGDRLLIFWLLVAGLFFQMYPLKAFNYLLPLIPALSLVAGRFVHDAALWSIARLRLLRARPRGRMVAPLGGVAAAAAAGLLLLALAVPVVDAAKRDSYFGLREAARWLKANTKPDDGVMTLSKGSAQYAISFYAHRDAYPFGRFRLATVLPGGKVLSPRPASDGPSRDWVTRWPPRLIENGTVSYLVYYTDEGDDPPENPLVDSVHQEKFRRFIESYGGRLVHVVYRNHEGRAWIYKVTKLLPRPRITFRPGPRRVTVRGEGFRFNSRVTLYYHQARRGTVKADGDGKFVAHIRAPYYVHQRYWMVALDSFGNYASSVGLKPTLRNRRARRRAGEGGGTESVRQGHAPLTARGVQAKRAPLKVTLEMPKAVPVGAELPVRVRVVSPVGGRRGGAQAHLFFQMFSRDGKTPVRWRERVTTTFGTAYLHIAAIELPGYYKLSVYASKNRHRGLATRTFKVRRR